MTDKAETEEKLWILHTEVPNTPQSHDLISLWQTYRVCHCHASYTADNGIKLCYNTSDNIAYRVNNNEIIEFIYVPTANVIALSNTGARTTGTYSSFLLPLQT